MQNEKHYTLTDKRIVSIAGLIAALILFFSYITALVQFSDNDVSSESEALENSEDISEENSESKVLETTSVIENTKKYKYYDDFQFESFSYKNSDVVNGSLAIIKDGSNGYPSIDQSKIVNIGNARTSDVYGLNNMSLVLYEEAIKGIDAFIVSFFQQVPKNGLIINKAFTSSDAISPSESLIDLTTGYAVQFSIYKSAYKFSDTEFGYLRDQAFRYGVIQRFPDGKSEYTGHDADHTIYRYVGLAHSEYMNLYRFSLEEYLDKIRTEGVIEYESQLEADTAYVIYYVPLDDSAGNTYVPLPQGDGYSYSVSGDGENGFVVTVKVSL